MGERKVLNKFIPSDFDPSLIPRGNKLSKKDGTVPVRMMLPFSVQCSTCSTFLYRGTKFNSKKEPMGGPDGRYLGIQRYRFYIKCTLCSRTVSFLTDPKNTDYEMEHGGTRNYEVYKDKEKLEEDEALEKEQGEKEDPMKALENRVLDSQREMKELDDLEAILAINRKHLQFSDVNAVLDAAHSKISHSNNNNENDDNKNENEVEELNEHGITKEEEELVKSIQFGRRGRTKKSRQEEENYDNDTNTNINNGRALLAVLEKNTPTIMRLNEDDERREEEKRKKDMEQLSSNNINKKNKNTNNPVLIPRIKMKRKKKKKIMAANNSTSDNNEENTNKKKQKKDNSSTTRTLTKKTQDNCSSTTSTNINPNSNKKETVAGGGGLASLLGGYGSSSAESE